jgi:hypothetical protein
MVWNGFTTPGLSRRLRVGELAGDERHFLRDLDLRFLVVERDVLGVEMMLVFAVAAERAEQRREVRAAVLDPADAEREPAGNGAGWAVRVCAAAPIASYAAAMMLAPPIGELKPPAAMLSSEPSIEPSSRRAPRLSAADLDDDRLDQHLRAADVERSTTSSAAA